MRIVLLGATRRGYLFLRKLTDLIPRAEFVVFSFPEEPWEPPFVAELRELTLREGGQFFLTRQVGSKNCPSFWESTPIDLILVIGWRYMISPAIYRRARLGTFVFHDSLLPEYRGFSPTVWAIINGEDHTGVTLFEISEEVDAGDIIDQERVPIGFEDTIGEIMEKVTQTYLELLERNLGRLLDGTAPRFPQDHSLASYTCKRLPEDNQIDWRDSSNQIYNLIRAVSSPYPGAYTYLGGQKIRIWAAQKLAENQRYVGKVPGRIVGVYPGKGSLVLTGDGSLLLTRVQAQGGEILCASETLLHLDQTLGR